MEKKSFILYTEWRELFKDMDDSVAGNFIKAIFDYQTGNDIDLLPETKLLFKKLRQDFDRDTAKYINKVEANRENGKLGGRPKSQNNPDKPKKPTGLNKNPNNLDNDNDNDLLVVVEDLKNLLGVDSVKVIKKLVYRFTTKGWVVINDPISYRDSIKAKKKTSHFESNPETKAINGKTFEYTQIPGKIASFK